MSEDIEIREFKNGEFQVWRGDEVLRPDCCEWLGDEHSEHEWMFFGSMKKALRQLKAALAKETCIKVHKVTIETL